MALMDYLRKHHGNDHEKMQMVALKFGMFRELAKTREDQAKKDLRKIHSRHLGEAGGRSVSSLSLWKERESDFPLPCSCLTAFLPYLVEKGKLLWNGLFSYSAAVSSLHSSVFIMSLSVPLSQLLTTRRQ